MRKYDIKIRPINGIWFSLVNGDNDYWDGVSAWTNKSNERQLYPTEDAAKIAFQAIQDGNKNSTVKEFIVPLVVKVYSEQHEYTLEDLAEHLTDAVTLELSGCGPSDTPCKTELELDFSDLKLKGCDG